MAFEVTPLPYEPTALDPAISAETLSFHHGKHHKAYIDKTNAAIAGTDLENAALEDVIKSARGQNQGLFNNSAQSWNHGFYWHSLTPSSGEPSEELQSMIDSAFGSTEALETQLKERGVGHFSNGWVWLIERGGKLEIGETHDGDTFADQDANPLLVIDLWEHAYYLDHQNLRPKYLEEVVGGKLNWAFASENLNRGTTWKYPC
ncbi:superoxide dismutase [Parafrankia sp. BMG5.11]|uniref:superoxide dismutase n=1 Tax=Parafrankia sp. BMG5.11 TaxID=222540 RepID=UPI00103CAD4A|nr:superoxide dismutase [Parafrankia sp. BMG5.11]TCJ40912.1 superoxide dismutase [Parafrankia sp. BMG5.11]